MRFIFFIAVMTFTLSIFAQDSPYVSASDSVSYYQKEKLKQEIEKLESENQIGPIIKILPSYAGILTALVAIIGAIISFLKYLKEKRNETEQKKEENQTRLEEKFDNIINKLGIEGDSFKASAAVSLLTFLKPEYKNFHDQVYLILLANLKMELHENVNAIMIKTFEKALQIKFGESRDSDLEEQENEFNFELNLSRMNLFRINLLKLKGLNYIDFSFSNLNHANLVECELIRARGYKADFSRARLSRSKILEGRFNESVFEEAHFHGTNLVSAKLKNTNLQKAEFQQAQLQDAHLDGADIRGAKFEQANLKNTFLRKIKYNDSDLKSILKSENESWKKAHFDDEVLTKLNNMASN